MSKNMMVIGRTPLEYVGVFQQRVLVVPIKQQNYCYVVNLAESDDYKAIDPAATLHFDDAEASAVGELLNNCMMNIGTLDELTRLNVYKEKMLHCLFQVGHAK